MNWFCINCGNLGRLSRKGITCPSCGYTGLSELDNDDFEATCIQRQRTDLLKGKKSRPQTSAKDTPTVRINPKTVKGVMDAD